MVYPIGELHLENSMPLIKMWNVELNKTKRDYTKHSHTRFEIAVINSGKGEYTTQRCTYPMEKGDVFIFSSNEPHCITSCNSDKLSITNLHFEPRYLSNNTTSTELINFCFSHSPEFENRIPCEKSESIRKNFNSIKEEFLKSDEHLNTTIEAYLKLLLIDLLRNHNYYTAETTKKANKSESLLLVYNYIEQHLCEKITLDDLSLTAHLTPNYLSYLFKETGGVSLWEYITAKRIEKAIHLLLSDNTLNITDIALQCGFNNTVNFNKAFKKYKGFTPSDLRKNPKLLMH